MNKFLSVFTNPYIDKPINIQYKSRNLAVVLLIIAVVTLLMSLLHLLMGNILNIVTGTGPAVLIAVIGLILLYKGKYGLSGTLVLAFLALTPLGASMVQSVSSYRDVFMYFHLCMPILVLSIIIGYSRWQLRVTALVEIIGGIIYLLVKILPAETGTTADLVSGVLFASIYFILAIFFLAISFNVERKIMERLQHNFDEGKSREDRLNTLLSSSKSMLSIGEELSGIAENSNLKSNDIEVAVDEIQVKIDELKEAIEKNDKDQTLLKDGGERIVKVMDKQTEAVNQSASSVEQMTASLLEITGSANEKSKGLETLAEKTKTTEESFNQTTTYLSSLEDSSKKVLEVLDVIEGIASGTNLLAMNAAIEAAHAGDAGRGFAVVAQEIRKLAEQTNQNSRLTRDILNKNNEDIQAVLKANLNNHNHFMEISSQTLEMKMALEEMISGLGEVSQGTGDINRILGDLRSINHSVSGTMDEINSIIEHNSENSNKINSSAQVVENSNKGIKKLSLELKNFAGRLLSIGGENAENLQLLNNKIDELET